MEMRPFGTTGTDVSVIGQGTWYMERSVRRTAVAAIQRGLDLGMNMIDTAELYGRGQAEEIVRDAIVGRRDQAFIVSKVLPSNASREGTIEACAGSLARLKTDHLDCYLLHWRGEHPLEETIASFEELKHNGKILSWGVSNFDVPDLEEARDIAGGDGFMVTNQVLYHLRDRAIEHSILPWCEEHKVAIMAYSPFGHGNFPAPGTAEGRLLKKIGEAHGATPRQVALGFLSRSPVVFAIPKASDIAHLEENAGAAKVHLTEEEIAQIDAAFPLGPARGLPML
jgi:diketogulonate reductase-like aldo/keto reductase